MLCDSDFNWRLYEHDHVLPVKHYPQIEKAETYRVLACRPCNTMKSTWDPNTQSQGDPAIVARDATAISAEQLQELVRRTKKHILEIRGGEYPQFFADKAVILDALQSLNRERGRSAAANSGE
jgi:hypothetical protein